MEVNKEKILEASEAYGAFGAMLYLINNKVMDRALRKEMLEEMKAIQKGFKLVF